MGGGEGIGLTVAYCMKVISSERGRLFWFGWGGHTIYVPCFLFFFQHKEAAKGRFWLVIYPGSCQYLLNSHQGSVSLLKAKFMNHDSALFKIASSVAPENQKKPKKNNGSMESLKFCSKGSSSSVIQEPPRETRQDLLRL